MNFKRIDYPMILLLLSPVPALADTANVTIYGVANVSYDVIDTGTSTAGTQGTAINKVSSNASRLGLKGTQELGDGLAANWQIEQAINIDNTTNSTTCTATPCTVTANNGLFATRNTFASLNSRQYGTLLLGRYDTPYKQSTRKLDNFSDSIGDNRSLLGGATSYSASQSFDGRQTDVIAYTSPSLGSFSAALAHANLSENATTATAAKASSSSLSLMFDNGSLYGAAAYETHKLDTIRAGGKENAWRLGLGYTFDDLKFGMAYEKTSDSLGGATAPAACAGVAAGSNCLGHQAWYLTGKYTIGSGALKAAYTRTGNLGDRINTGASQYSFGYDYRLDKNSTLFALYTRLTNESAANYGLGNSAFSSGATPSIGAGADPSAFSIGMKYSF